MKLKLAGYAGFIIVCLCFSFFRHFPATDAADYMEHRLSQWSGSLNVSIDGIRPVLPVGLSSDDMQFEWGKMNPVNLSDPRIYLKPFSLLTNTVRMPYEFDVFEGSVSGQAAMAKDNTTHMNVDSVLNNIHLKNVRFGNRFGSFLLTGLVRGSINSELTRFRPRYIEGWMTVENGRLKFTEPFFTLDELPFSLIELNVKMPSKNSVVLENCSLKGNMIDADITGDIALSPRFSQWRPNVTVKLKFHPEFFVRHGNDTMKQLIVSSASDRDILTVSVKGTVEKPRIRLNQEEE